MAVAQNKEDRTWGSGARRLNMRFRKHGGGLQPVGGVGAKSSPFYSYRVKHRIGAVRMGRIVGVSGGAITMMWNYEVPEGRIAEVSRIFGIDFQRKQDRYLYEEVGPREGFKRTVWLAERGHYKSLSIISRIARGLMPPPVDTSGEFEAWIAKVDRARREYVAYWKANLHSTRGTAKHFGISDKLIYRWLCEDGLWPDKEWEARILEESEWLRAKRLFKQVKRTVGEMLRG